MPSTGYLFLILLLLVALLPILLLKSVRRHAARTITLAARALNDSRAWALRIFQALRTPNTELPLTIMSDRDENDRWRALIRESEATIEQYLFPRIDTDLASFVRCISFRVFLVVFLGVDPNLLVSTNVQMVTGALTDFYNDRRGESTLPPEVQRILYEWLPCRQFPFSLDRILPAYEALWRIIATLVVTCEDDETKALRWVMLDFRDNPRDRQYEASFEDDGRSVSTITDGVVSRITPGIARPPHASTSTWPLSCMQYASVGGSEVRHPPTAREALKLAALLASVVIGRIGVQYGITGNGMAAGSQASPWDQRRIFGIIRGESINVEIRRHPSKQDI